MGDASETTESRPHTAASAKLPSRFQLEQQLGRGALFEVWLAHDSSLNQRVALKYCRPDVHATSGRSLLRNEAEMLARLSGPGVVELLAAETDAELDPELASHSTAAADRAAAQLSPWLALAYLRGGSLTRPTTWAASKSVHSRPDDTIRQGSQLLGDALALARTLQRIHNAGFAHLDLKASNVVRHATGEPTLIDFECAAPLGEAGHGGSPKGQSPARLLGEPASIADDIYGFGCLLYEVFSGTPPLGVRPTRHDILSRIPESLRVLAPDLPEPVALGIDRMLAKAPGERPRDFEAVIELLLPWTPGAAPPGRAEVRTLGPKVVSPKGILPPAPKPKRGRGALTPQDAGPSVWPRILIGASAAAGMVGLLATFVLAVGDPPGAAADRDAAVTSPQQPRSPGAEANADSEPTSRGRTDPKQLERERSNASAALGRWASIQARLEARGAEYWGAREWASATEAAAEGDTFYQARDYAAAAARYADAEARLIELQARESEILRDALAAGVRALAAGERDEALRQFEVALRIDPENSRAENGRERALKLDRTLQRVRAAMDAERSGELAEARSEFRAALELDPEYRPAKNGLARVTSELNRLQVERLISQGFEALEADRFEAARKSFREALAISPDASLAREGLSQLEAESELAKIRSLRDRAQQAEAEERWADAVAAYEAAGAIDSALRFVTEGLERAQRRQELAQQIDSLIQAPGRLFTREVRDTARQWIAAVDALDPRPSGLAQRAARLSELIALAAKPVSVVFESDNQTRIVLLRVGALGSFERRETQLEPGSYTVVGIREGYRDVRQSFVVTPGKPLRISIRAEEAI